MNKDYIFKLNRFLLKAGAKNVGSTNLDNRTSNDNFYKYELKTFAGILFIWLAEPSIQYNIFCKFNNPKKAYSNLPIDLIKDLNPVSGKWNWHYNNYTKLEKDFKKAITTILKESIYE